MAGVDIVIVNWNTGALLGQCLRSIDEAQQTGLSVRVVVVDNASSDGSLAATSAVKTPITIIHNDSNRGFAAACNQGAAASTGDYVLFLNPDTRLAKNALVAPTQFLGDPARQQIGILGIQLVDEAGRVTPTCARFPTTGRFLAAMLGLDRALPGMFPPHFMVEWDHAAIREVDQVMGAFFLIRRSVFAALGGFDEQFFVYFEEVDLALRARAAGWRTCYLPAAQAYHQGGGNLRDHLTATRLFYSMRSRILYGRKHFSWWNAALLTAATLIIEPTARTVRAALQRSPSQIAATLKAFGDLWRAAPRGFDARPRRKAS